jgi:hypothetical protein
MATVTSALTTAFNAGRIPQDELLQLTGACHAAVPLITALHLRTVHHLVTKLTWLRQHRAGLLVAAVHEQQQR